MRVDIALPKKLNITGADAHVGDVGVPVNVGCYFKQVFINPGLSLAYLRLIVEGFSRSFRAAMDMR